MADETKSDSHYSMFCVLCPTLETDTLDAMIGFDTLITIFEFLSTRDLGHVQQVCRSWKAVSCIDPLWRAHCEKMGITSIDDFGEWRTLYRKKVISKIHWNTGKRVRLFRRIPEMRQAHVSRHRLSATNAIALYEKDYILSGGENGIVKIWHQLHGNLLSEMKGHTYAVRDIAVDNGIVASCSNDKTVRIWNIQSKRCAQTLRGSSEWLRCVDVSAEHNLVISGEMQQVHGWDVNTGAEIWNHDCGTHAIYDVFLQGSILFTAGGDKFVKQWDIRSPNPLIGVVDVHRGEVYCLWYNESSNMVSSGSYHGQVLITDLRNGATIHEFDAQDSVFAMQFDSEKLVVGGYPSCIQVWDLSSNAIRFIMRMKPMNQSSNNDSLAASVHCIEYDETRLFAGLKDGSVRGWDFSI